VHAYECPGECNWTGMLPSPSRLARRKRQALRAFAVVVLLIAAGLAAWKYGAGLPWGPAGSSGGDEVEEESEGQ